MPQIGQLKTATRLNLHKNKLPHVIPLKAVSFKNAATYQKLKGTPPPPCTMVGVWLCMNVSIPFYIYPFVMVLWDGVILTVSSGLTGLSKVAGCWRKSLPTWLVSASYFAWYFFMDCLSFLYKIFQDWPLQNIR